MRLSVAPLLSIKDLTMAGPDERSPLFRGLELDVQPGERVALFGPRGSGKSTLLRLLAELAGHDAPYAAPGAYAPVADRLVGRAVQGRVLLAPELRGACLLVGERPDTQLFRLTVADELAFALRLTGQPPGPAAGLAAALLETLGIAHLAERRLDTLSAGERQRVVVAAALARRPTLLLLDDPTAHLDRDNARALLRRIGEACAASATALVASLRRPEQAALFADRALQLDEGRLLAGLPPDEAALPRVRRPAGSAGTADATPRLCCEALTVWRGERRVLCDLDLTIDPGEIVAVVGPSGAGKTTLAEVLARMTPLRSGKAHVGSGSERQRRRRPAAVAFPAGTGQFLWDTPAREMGGLGQPVTTEARLQEFALSEAAGRPIAALSSGERQALALAVGAGLAGPLLVLDEPSAGLDPAGAARAAEALFAAVADGPGVLVLVHDADDPFARHAGRVLRLAGGRLRPSEDAA